MTWDYPTGNLTQRKEIRTGNTLIENFTYDNLNRLTGSTIGSNPQTITYSASGNILSKTDAGAYTYASSKINAVTQISNPNNTNSINQQDVAYTPFFQPATITENLNLMSLVYGADYERRKSTLTVGRVITKRYYLGSYEKEITGTNTRHIHYVSAGDGIIAIIVRENTGADVINYIYTDHLGSIVSATNETGTVIAEQNFDAWGRNRNPNNWTYNAVPTAPIWLYRGYTGHEHLPVFGLINMNGRLYDPIVGRMLSVDNFVHGGGSSTQGYNRYSYVLNNPLRYKDPSGENPILLGAALIGGVANLWVNWDKIDNFKEGAAYFAVGALGGLMAITPGLQTSSVPTVAALNITADAIYGNTPKIESASDAINYVAKSGLVKADGTVVLNTIYNPLIFFF